MWKKREQKPTLTAFLSLELMLMSVDCCVKDTNVWIFVDFFFFLEKCFLKLSQFEKLTSMAKPSKQQGRQLLPRSELLSLSSCFFSEPLQI